MEQINSGCGRDRTCNPNHVKEVEAPEIAEFKGSGGTNFGRESRNVPLMFAFLGSVNGRALPLLRKALNKLHAPDLGKRNEQLVDRLQNYCTHQHDYYGQRRDEKCCRLSTFIESPPRKDDADPPEPAGDGENEKSFFREDNRRPIASL
jgi:hypothetical protein